MLLVTVHLSCIVTKQLKYNSHCCQPRNIKMSIGQWWSAKWSFIFIANFFKRLASWTCLPGHNNVGSLTRWVCYVIITHIINNKHQCWVVLKSHITVYIFLHDSLLYWYTHYTSVWKSRVPLSLIFFFCCCMVNIPLSQTLFVMQQSWSLNSHKSEHEVAKPGWRTIQSLEITFILLEYEEKTNLPYFFPYNLRKHSFWLTYRGQLKAANHLSQPDSPNKIRRKNRFWNTYDCIRRQKQ